MRVNIGESSLVGHGGVPYDSHHMTVHIVTHEACLAHECNPEQPERPERLAAIRDELEKSDLKAKLIWHEAPAATRAQIERCHPPSYIDHIESFCAAGGGALDPDTSVVTASWEAALRSAGGAIHAVHLALDHSESVFVAGRPPGHHAESEKPMGFCLFGNVALAAYEALTRDNVERVLIVDWDVHHGNGTQALVEHDPAIHFISLHQWPLYPGTGKAEERGVGNVWNVPRAPGLDPEIYVKDLAATIEEATRDWAPDLVLISAGFDAMRGDPLAGMTLEAEHYRGWTEQLRAVGGPVVAVLEGGYNIDNLRAGVRVTVETLD